MITIEAMGLENAAALTEYMRVCLAEYAGCYYKGTKREESSTTNAQVLEYLAKPKQRKDGVLPKRNLKTFSDKFASELGEIWKRIIEDRAARIASAPTGSPVAMANAQAQARAASGSAWKACGLAVLARMQDRANSGVSAMGDNGDEGQATAVLPEYAARRKKMFGVDESAVYKSSGQLLEDLSPEAGRITLQKTIL